MSRSKAASSVRNSVSDPTYSDSAAISDDPNPWNRGDPPSEVS